MGPRYRPFAEACRAGAADQLRNIEETRKILLGNRFTVTFRTRAGAPESVGVRPWKSSPYGPRGPGAVKEDMDVHQPR